MNRSRSRKSFTCFEDLSNEIIYEIFEFLDFDSIYQTFSMLNNRYYKLVNHSTLPIKLNLSSMSKTTFENYNKHIIIPCRHRINLIYLTNPLIFDLSSSPLHNLLQFPRLKTLIIENIESKNLENLLQHLASLPNLSSLIIIPIDYIQNKNILYHQIFRLPVLRYCKVSFKERFPTQPLHISNHQYSPIKHFVIDSNCNINYLNILLSYLPQLCRLSCNNLTGSRFQHTNLQSIVLNNLTHLYIKIEDLSFDQIELFFTNLRHQLQVFHLSTNYDITYLNAYRWQEFILSNMSNLRIFDIQLLPNYNSNQFISHLSINQFMTPFWFERKWFFRYEYENSFAGFYSIKPYEQKNFIANILFYFFRRNNYTLNNLQYEDTYPCQNKNILHSVNHISIRGNIATKNDLIYFPNITELKLFDYSNRSLHSISSIFDRMIPLTKLYKLSIYCRNFCVSQLMDLLYFSPNIHILIINSVSLSKISLISIEQTQTFQTIFKENKIKNIIFKEDSTLQTIQLFYKLCPRLEHITIDLIRYDPFIIIQLFINNKYYYHVPLLCFLNINEISERMIQSYLPIGCSIKSVERNLYIWS